MTWRANPPTALTAWNLQYRCQIVGRRMGPQLEQIVYWPKCPRTKIWLLKKGAKLENRGDKVISETGPWVQSRNLCFCNKSENYIAMSPFKLPVKQFLNSSGQTLKKPILSVFKKKLFFAFQPKNSTHFWNVLWNHCLMPLLVTVVCICLFLALYLGSSRQISKKPIWSALQKRFFFLFQP